MDDLEKTLESIPTIEFPGLESLVRLAERVSALEENIDRLAALVSDAKKVEATVLSGALPGGLIHDRLAEVRAAVKELTDASQPHHAAAQAALRLNWGGLAVEE